MSDAVDTDVKSNRRSKKVDQAAPEHEARQRWAKESKRPNPIIESFYEVAQGHKLLLCKRRESGSVHRVLVGSSNEKDATGALTAHARQVQAKINSLQKEGKLKIRM